MTPTEARAWADRIQHIAHSGIVEGLRSLANQVEALQKAADQAPEPVAWLLTDDNINSIQIASMQKLIDRAKHAHFTGLMIRINGQDEHYEANWLKHLQRVAPPSESAIRAQERERCAKVCEQLLLRVPLSQIPKAIRELGDE